MLKASDVERGRDALEGKGLQRRPQRRSDRRSEEVAKAVGGGYCRLRMPLQLVAVRGTVAGHRLGALDWGGGGLPRSNASLGAGVPSCPRRVAAGRIVPPSPDTLLSGILRTERQAVAAESRTSCTWGSTLRC